MAGVRIPPGEFTVVPTPPPEIDVEAWLESIDRIEAVAPQRLRLTHFGLAEDPAAQLDRARESLLLLSERAREDDRQRYLAAIEAEIRGSADPSTAESMLQAVPPEETWVGLERYWRKRAEADRA